MEGQVTALLVQNLDRLDERQKEDADGVHNSLGKACLLICVSLVLACINRTWHSLTVWLSSWFFNYISFILYMCWSAGHQYILCVSAFHHVAILENMAEFRQEICIKAGEQGLLSWLLKRLKVGVFRKKNGFVLVRLYLLMLMFMKGYRVKRS